MVASAIVSAFLALCCLGWAPALGLLGAAGLGFLATDAVLIPLLALSLLALGVAARSARRHGRKDR